MTESLQRILVVPALLFLVAAGCSINIRTVKQADGGVFRSDDAGLTWRQVVQAGTTEKGKPITLDNVDVAFTKFDPNDAAIIYLATRGSGLYRSDDAGEQWVKTGLGMSTPAALAIDPQTTSILYAASGGTIAKTTDGGAHWSPIYFETKPDRLITDLVVRPTRPNEVLAATSTAEVLLSKDYGNTWQLYSSLNVADRIVQLVFATGDVTTLYAQTSANALLKSADGGTTWTSLKPSLNAYPKAASVASFAMMPNTPEILYIATGYGLLQTTDGGTTWRPIQTLVPFASQPLQFVAVNPENQRVLYVIVGNRLRKSEDGGTNWDAKITIPTGRLISSLALNPKNPNQVFIGTVKPKKR